MEAPSAQSAVDNTPPTLSVPVKASFTVGKQIDVGSYWDCASPGDVTVYRVPLDFSWSGSDASRYVRYRLEALDYAGGPYDVFYDSAQTSYEDSVGSNNYAPCGGPDYSIVQWSLTASDAAGNATTKTLYGGQIRLTQDSNLADQANYATQPTIAYKGKWGLSVCTCWSDGGVHQTTGKGATATITPTPFSQSSGASNHHVGLVMQKGPNRGKFKVYVDGVARATVDLYAKTSQPRTIVWQTAFLAYGHRIRIENLATPGRPRIDLDAVVTN